MVESRCGVLVPVKKGRGIARPVSECRDKRGGSSRSHQCVDVIKEMTGIYKEEEG